MVVGRHWLFHQFHQRWRFSTKSAKRISLLFVVLSGSVMFFKWKVMERKLPSGAFSGQHQPPREVSSKHTKTHNSPVKGKEHVAPQKAEVWWRMRSWRDIGCFVQSIMVLLYEATSKSITIVKPSIKVEELSLFWVVFKYKMSYQFPAFLVHITSSKAFLFVLYATFKVTNHEDKRSL